MDSSCRTCSRHDEFTGISLESLSERHQEPIHMMLIYCTQLQITANDSLPQQICSTCMLMLDRAFTFWEQCRFSDAYFRWGPSPAASEVPESEPPQPEPAKVVEAPAPRIPPVDPTPTPPPPPQRYWCCIRKCPEERASLEEMETHAKEAHSSKRIFNEKLRSSGHAYVCAVCNAGFETLGKYESHRTVLLGLTEKGGIGTSEDAAEDSNTRISQSVRDALDRITSDMKDKLEAKARTRKDDFVIYMRRADYETICSTKASRGLFLKRMKNFSKRVCQKAVRLVQICNSCRFESNVYTDMQRHIEKEHAKNATCSYALKTHIQSETFFRCIQCDYETHRKDTLLRHQMTNCHEGIEIIRPPPDDGNDLIEIKNEPPPPSSEDEDESQDEEEPTDDPEEPSVTLTCTHCGMILRTDEDKQRHLLYECDSIHSKTARYTCEHCKSVSTKTVEALKRHMRECSALQGKPRNTHRFIPKTCPKCGRTFNTNEGLVRHSIFCTMDHANPQSLTCPNCQRVFSKKFHLERHLNLRICVKLASNPCRFCRATFPDPLALKRHKKVGCPALLNPEAFGLHTPCVCPRCGRKFATKKTLKRHEIVDFCRDAQSLTGGTVRKFQCPYCWTQLINTKGLQRHLQANCLVLLQRQAEQERRAVEAEEAQDGVAEMYSVPPEASSDHQVGGDEEMYEIN